ncbi:LytR/AlgR family response regulator transcription factor [Ascidiimonas sp. W6]|uniref:LytR/AlgR family response regulator transcription factor n=1 Tax=Ascidiimonas meishanensis TaxID=3128903 RepID=UPI0030EF0156
MNCIIIDDEAAARAILGQLAKGVESLNVLEEFPNAIQAMKFLNQHEVDLIFLDIHMPDFTGFDFIQSLRNPPRIILTTSDRNLAIDAFEYECIVDYLVKPLSLPRFLKSVQRAKNFKPLKQEGGTQTEKEDNSANDLYVNIDRRLIKINMPDIFFIEAKGDYINIRTEVKNYLVHSTMKKIEEKLPDSIFLKVHRSYIINLKKIIDIEDNSVLIEKSVIPVSRSSKPELIKRLNLL